MAVLRANIRIQTTTFTPNQMASILPNIDIWTAATKGEPVSRRKPQGPQHSVSTFLVSSSAHDNAPLAAHIQALRPTLEALERVAEKDLEVDLLLMVESADMGAMYSLPPADITLIARANCGVTIDAYQPSTEGPAD